MIILDIYEVAKLFVARGLHGPTSQPKLYFLFVKIFVEKNELFNLKTFGARKRLCLTNLEYCCKTMTGAQPTAADENISEF